MEKRTQDIEEKVRNAAVSAICDGAAENPGNIYPDLLACVKERLRDKKVYVAILRNIVLFIPQLYITMLFGFIIGIFVII